MKKHLIILILLSLVYCTKENKSKTEIIESVSQNISIPQDTVATQSIVSDEELFQNLNSDLLQLLKEKKIAKFGSYIHPEKGITFSMYAHIDPKKDKHFTQEEFTKYLPTNIKFTWAIKTERAIHSLFLLKII